MPKFRNLFRRNGHKPPSNSPRPRAGQGKKAEEVLTTLRALLTVEPSGRAVFQIIEGNLPTETICDALIKARDGFLLQMGAAQERAKRIELAKQSAENAAKEKAKVK